MHLSDLPVENLKSICSFLGGYSYVAGMVPYLRSCVKEVGRINFITEVYQREDFALIYLYDLFPLYDNVKECIGALVKNENLTILGWLLTRKPGFLYAVGREAEVQGSYKILAWCMFQGYKILEDAISKVVVSGNTKLYHYLHFLGYHHSNAQGPAVFYGGHLDILCEVEDLDSGLVSSCAAQAGHLHILQWLKEKELLDKKAALEGAMRGLQRKVILWLGEIDLSACYLAVVSGSEEEKIDFLEWLEERTQLDYNKVAITSSYRGCMKVVRWCAKRTKLSPRFFRGVCRKGTREDLDFFASLGYYRHEKGYYVHAFNAVNMDALLWLEEQTNEGRETLVMRNVFPASNKEENIIACLEWKLERGWSGADRELLENLIRQRKSKVFAWLTERILLDKATIHVCMERCIEVSCAEIFTLLFRLDHGLSRQDIILLLDNTHQNKSLYNPLFVEEVEKLLH
ncbi:hypothetical protein [Cedratvirus kamchatka]|uniref:Ankyrin repeat-containing protein n=1 Tax=Cedratvirus kamchatka TaxID=2716914 RepID=A0A6G8MYM1_9VIRU|nr:hypothetical protein [Cedratvirus kamchatka]